MNTATVASDALTLLKLNQRIAHLMKMRDKLQAEINAQRGMQTSEQRISANVDKFIGGFTREHLTALRTISHGRIPKRGKVLNELFYWCCAGAPNPGNLRGIRLSAIGKHAFAVLDKKFAAEDAERAEGLFALYNA